MKILVVTNIFETTVNGPFYLPHWLLKINDLYPQHEVRIVTDDVSEPSDKIYKIQIKYARHLKKFASVLDNIPFYRACLKIKKEYDYDIVFFNVATLGALASRLLPKNIKIWGVVHTDHYILPDRLNYKSLKAYLYFAYLEHGLERTVLRGFDRVFFCSDYTRLVFARFFPKHIPKMRTLLQTIDIKNISFLPIPIVSDQIIKILLVKSDVLRGRIYILMEALSQLKDYSFELTIIGANKLFEKDIRAWLEKNAAKNINLNYCGVQPSSEVFAAMKSHHILCMPVHSEALGLANVEGLAHGISVVATNVGGIPEVMNNGKNGWLVEPDNVESLAKGLKKCIECPAHERLEIQKNARLFVEQHFDYRAMLPYFVSFLEE